MSVIGLCELKARDEWKMLQLHDSKRKFTERLYIYNCFVVRFVWHYQFTLEVSDSSEFAL